VAWEGGDFGRFIRKLTGRPQATEPAHTIPATR
jgi:hypothetical protein